MFLCFLLYNQRYGFYGRLSAQVCWAAERDRKWRERERDREGQRGGEKTDWSTETFSAPSYLIVYVAYLWNEQPFIMAWRQWRSILLLCLGTGMLFCLLYPFSYFGYLQFQYSSMLPHTSLASHLVVALQRGGERTASALSGPRSNPIDKEMSIFRPDPTTNPTIKINCSSRTQDDDENHSDLRRSGGWVQKNTIKDSLDR